MSSFPLLLVEAEIQEVAEGKKAFQSSTYFNQHDCRPGFRFTPDLAIDGNTNPSLSGCSCAVTENSGSNHWWLVDLLAIYVINHIVIYNRGDGWGK